MGDLKQKEIVIKSATGEGEKLVDCYYTPKPENTFNFHDKDDKVKRRDITLGSEFSVVLDEYPDTVWHLTFDPDQDHPNRFGGTWRTGNEPGMADGTYQAEASGGGEEEDTSAASAGGYTA